MSTLTCDAPEHQHCPLLVHTCNTGLSTCPCSGGCAGPVSLLSGLNQRPRALVMHFFLRSCDSEIQVSVQRHTRLLLVCSIIQAVQPGSFPGHCVARNCRG